MRCVRFFIYHFLLSISLFALYFYFDESMQKPFSLVGILKTLIIVLMAMSAFGWMDKLENRVRVIRLRIKIPLSFLALVLAFLFGGLLTGEITL
jgi:DMSO/TMAO reductase YedYZ heme-binding membrane subunit